MARKTKFDESKYIILEAYIESGCAIKLSEDDEEYLNILTLMNSMRRKYGMVKTIKFFQNPPYSISQYRSKEMYYESINLFYSDEKVEKKALRNLKAEQLEKAAELALAAATSVDDLDIYKNIILASAKLRELDKIDLPEIPKELYEKPIKIYTLKPEQLKLPQADRNELALIIDALETGESDKKRFRMEAMVEDIDFIDLLDEQEENLKNRQ